jgi:hypothetical protein
LIPRSNNFGTSYFEGDIQKVHRTQGSRLGVEYCVKFVSGYGGQRQELSEISLPGSVVRSDRPIDR